MFKNTENIDFIAAIMFYLIILQLLNDDTSDDLITIFDLVEYFKRNKKIVINLDINKKLLLLFSKNKTLLSTIQVNNKSCIISDINKLIKKYNRLVTGKNFVNNFCIELNKIIDKITLGDTIRFGKNNRDSNVKNIHQVIIALLIVGVTGLKRAGKFIRKILKFKMEFFKKFSRKNKSKIDKHECLLNDTYILNRNTNKININKNVYNVNVGNNLNRQSDMTVKNQDNFVYISVEDKNINKMIDKVYNVENMAVSCRRKYNSKNAIKIHKCKNTKYHNQRCADIDKPKTNSMIVKNTAKNMALNNNISNSIDMLEDELEKKYRKNSNISKRQNYIKSIRQQQIINF